jgi:hypothetical protein
VVVELDALYAAVLVFRRGPALLLDVLEWPLCGVEVDLSALVVSIPLVFFFFFFFFLGFSGPPRGGPCPHQGQELLQLPLDFSPSSNQTAAASSKHDACASALQKNQQPQPLGKNNSCEKDAGYKGKNHSP